MHRCFGETEQYGIGMQDQLYRPVSLGLYVRYRFSGKIKLFNADENNFWFLLVSDKVESYMYKFTVTDNEPPKMYRYIGSAPIDIRRFHELNDINQFSELLLPVYQLVHLFNDSLSVNKF